jgi:type II secretory pathway pseudopilin PulG
MRRTEGGVALLETLVALAILSGAGLGLVELVSASVAAQWDARERERVLAVEARLLTALTLLKREELDRRLGRRPIGDVIVDVERPEPTLYRISLVQARAPDVEDLVTVVYRKEARRGS